MSDILEFDLTSKKSCEHLKQLLLTKWKDVENVPDVFRYQLGSEKSAVLDGDLKFFVQLNSKRTALRRPPQKIVSIRPEFNLNEFNFNKVDKREILLNIRYIESLITILINNSPLTPYHSLIVPDLALNNPQILSRTGLSFSIDLLRAFNDKHYRIGYNSPGALASVNHLHLHIIHLEQYIYVEDAELQHVARNMYKLASHYPAPAFCFPLLPVNADSTGNTQRAVIDDVLKIIEYFCEKSVPHNLFITYGPYAGCSDDVIKVYIFPRETMQITKEFSTFNIAFCELSGYVPVGSDEVYNSLTEDVIKQKIRHEVGDAFGRIESDVLALFSG